MSASVIEHFCTVSSLNALKPCSTFFRHYLLHFSDYATSPWCTSDSKFLKATLTPQLVSVCDFGYWVKSI